MSTVSNVLNNPHVVALPTRRRVEAAMDTMGFVRNAAARQLRGARSQVVGCVLLDIANPFFADVARGIEDRLAESGCMMMLCSTDVRATRQAHYLRTLEEQGVRGIIVNPVSPDLQQLRQLRERGTPVVLLDHPPGDSGLCAATVDNVHGGRIAAAHLIELGHRRIAYLQGEVAIPSITDRSNGIRLAIAAAGLPDDTLAEIRTAATRNADSADEAIDRLLALTPTPTAIICFNDTAALGAITGLRRHGLDVPGDVSVVGYDDVRFAAGLAPPLTTIRQPRYQLGWTAADLLLTEHDYDHQHKDVQFRPALAQRASTAPRAPA